MANATLSGYQRDDDAGRRRGLLGAALAGGAVLVLLVAGRRLAALLPAFTEWIDGLGLWAPAAFVAGYALATVAFVPGSLLTMSAGLVFGLVRGTALVLLGATLGATAAFLISRYAVRGVVERRLRARPAFARIDRAIGRQGLRIGFLLRLSPLFPFNLLNYALGVTSIRLRDYVLASAGMLPATFLYVYYGRALGSLAVVAGGAEIERGPGWWVLLFAGLAATAAVSALVARIARRALEREVGDG